MLKNNYQKDIYKFIDNYFKEIDDISEFHLNFFIKNKIQTIDLNLLILHKFIFQAFSFLRTNTGFYFSRFVNKLINDIKNLIEYLHDFEKKTKMLNNVFENRFLQNLPEYNILKTKIDKNLKILHSTNANIASLETQIKFFNPKNKEDTDELKRLKGKLVDSIHYNAKAKEEIEIATKEINLLKTTLRETFFNEFTKTKQAYISKFHLVLNTKLYYLNKQMWKEVNQNKKALSYFQDLGLNHINLKLYIHNYLKHIDITRSKNYEEYAKIEDILKGLDE